MTALSEQEARHASGAGAAVGAAAGAVIDVACPAPDPRHVRARSHASASPAPRLSAGALRNIRLMHFLERVAARFNESGVPLMALKGAVLNLTVYERPDDRPMSDLDLLVRPEDLDRAQEILEDLDGLRSPDQFREDFFPRFYYEVQYTAGDVYPVTVDLHVRPFRPLRLAHFVPDSAFWESAVEIHAGRATILAPSAEHMLMHLAAHSAIHANPLEMWREDLRRWVDARHDAIDWERFLADVGRWRLALAVGDGLRAAEEGGAPSLCPDEIRGRLDALPVNWRDRLAFRQAPRDEKHKFAQVLVNVLTTPGWRNALAYVGAVLVPNRQYLDAWCMRHGYRNRGAALLARCVAPFARRLPRWRGRTRRIEVRRSAIHGHGVFARRDLAAGTVIARYRGLPIGRDGVYVSTHTDEDGGEGRHEITGPLRFLNHSCRPNAELRDFRLVALRDIRADREITIDYGDEACDCRRSLNGATEEDA